MSLSVAIFFTAGLLVALGVVLVVIGRRGRESRLKRNPYAGVRTAITMSSDKAWDVAHRACAVHFAVAGYGMVAGGVLLGAAGVLVRDAFLLGTLMTGISLVAAAWTVVWVIVGAVLAQRAAKEATEGEAGKGPRPRPQA